MGTDKLQEAPPDGRHERSVRNITRNMKPLMKPPRSQNATTNDPWEKMDGLVNRPLIDDPGVSINEFAKRYRLTYKGAWTRLGDLVSQGKMLVGHRRNAVNGRAEKVYRLA